MADISITLTIPRHVYAEARRLAEETDMPIEQVLINQLETAFVKLPPLPPHEQEELDALAHLSDDTLRTIAIEQMQTDQQKRMQVLMELNNLGTISAEGRLELAELVEQGQRLILRKAKAIALLAQRGNPIDLTDLDVE